MIRKKIFWSIEALCFSNRILIFEVDHCSLIDIVVPNAIAIVGLLSKCISDWTTPTFAWAREAGCLSVGATAQRWEMNLGRTSAPCS
jgi:hypothetical protein